MASVDSQDGGSTDRKLDPEGRSGGRRLRWDWGLRGKGPAVKAGGLREKNDGAGVWQQVRGSGDVSGCRPRFKCSQYSNFGSVAAVDWGGTAKARWSRGEFLRAGRGSIPSPGPTYPPWRQPGGRWPGRRQMGSGFKYFNHALKQRHGGSVFGDRRRLQDLKPGSNGHWTAVA
jgi:hypothetical protein